MKEKNIAMAEAYYKAMKARDLDVMKTFLHPDAEFLGPVAELSGRENVLDGYRYFLTYFNELNIRTICGSEDHAMIAYDLSFPQPIGSVRTAALLTFKDNLISRIEIFCDARSLVKS